MTGEIVQEQSNNLWKQLEMSAVQSELAQTGLTILNITVMVA